MYSPKYSKAQSCAYFCSKNVLVALNTLYIFIALVLIGVAVYAKASAKITSLPILGGVIACGVFLLLVAVLGVVGAVRHSQVILFFYMVILFLVFVIQFSVSIAAVAISHNRQADLMKAGWQKIPNKSSIKEQIQSARNCCGFQNKSLGLEDPLGHPDCKALPCCENSDEWSCPKCRTCYDTLEDVINHLLKVAGGIGLFFSFSLLFGVCMTYRYRHQRDPRANPGAFL